MEKKRLLAGFGCRNGRAVRICGDGNEELYPEDILTLAQSMEDGGADGLLLCDLSADDEDHERTIDVIRQIVRAVDLPLIAGGRTARLEDVKKYLYAGASAVFLNVSDEGNVALIKEAADRFGSEKICAYLPGVRCLRRHIEEYVRLGASAAFLDEWMDGQEAGQLPAAPVPLYAVFGCASGAAIDACLTSAVSAGAVITGMSPADAENCFIRRKQELKEQGVPTEILDSSVAWEDLKPNADGLVPVIVQDCRTDEVLMLAYMDRESFAQTLLTGKMTYFSRSRQKLWVKGETSGHFQYLRSLKLDCDNDTLLAKVRQIGAACHTGARSCFFQTLAEKPYRDKNPLRVFEDVFAVILDRRQNPKEGSYTNYLFDKGLDKILKKVGEEATETVIAAKNPDPEELRYEIADLLYHMMVLMAEKGITWEEITRELANR